MDSKGPKRDFKKGISGDDGRRRREEKSVALRKDKKEEGLSKRRNVISEEKEENVPIATTSSIAPVSTSSGKFTIADIPSLMMGMNSNDSEVQVNSVRGFRKLLSIEKNPPVQNCIDCGAIPLFVQFLLRHDCQPLQFEASWALTNIASTDRTRVVVESNALPYLVQLLQSPNADIREQCAWCLGNIAGDGPELRDTVLALNAMELLTANVAQPATLPLLRNCTWALSNFCRGKPQPPLSVVAPALPVLANILLQNADQDTVIDATWALSYISDGEDVRIQTVVGLGIVPSLVNMLTSNKNQLIVPALRTLGNIVSGKDTETQAVINANALTALVPLLQSTKKNIRKEACWMLSNIVAGTKDQISQVLHTPELLPRVLAQLSSSAEWDVRKEASWVISNIATGGNKQHVMRIVEHGAIYPLCELLEVGAVPIIVLALEAIESILKYRDDEAFSERVIKLIDEAGGVDKLEQLQEHENEDVYNKAVSILEKYFGGEEGEDESENLAPSSQNQAAFSFGIPMNNSVSKTPTTFSFGGPSAAPKQISNSQSVFQFGVANNTF